MLQTSSDDLFLPSYQDEELVDNLLCSEDSEDSSSGSGLSLAKALLPLVESMSPDLLPSVCSTRYKTRLCTNYSTSGSCKYGDSCHFAHGLHELHVPFRHPKYKTELCRSYHTTGFCYYGSRCLFVHDLSEQRQVHPRRRNVPCRTFCSFGVCPFGSRCNFLHLDGDVGGDVSSDGAETSSSPSSQIPPQLKEWKRRGTLCHTFSTFGFCLFGTRCWFQHELPNKIKTSDQNQAGCPQPSPASSGLPSCSSSNASTSSAPPTPPLSTPSPDTVVHNAFTFSSQHLSDLLLPLALQLQQLDSSKGPDMRDSRAL